jgi:predicted Zn-dependent peptidase
VRRLVREERVAYDVSVSVQEQDLGSELLIESRAVGRSSPLHLRDRILQEIGRLAEEPLEPDELERARVQLTIDTVRSLRTAFGRGDLIGSIALLHDDLDRGCATREGFLDVTPDEVRDLARRLARRDSTVCVTLEAKEK